MLHVILLTLGTAFASNLVLTKTYGLDAAAGDTTKNFKKSLMLAATVAIISFLASIIGFVFYRFVLTPLKVQFLSLLVTAFVVLGIVMLFDLCTKNKMMASTKLIFFDSAVLAIALNIAQIKNFGDVVLIALGEGIGFFVVFMLLTGMRERQKYAKIPKAFAGLPLALISLGLMAMAFEVFKFQYLI